jgi:hypothetical protein
VEQAGFQFAHRGLNDVFTCNIGGSARLIDYIFYSSGLSAEAVVTGQIDNRTILPSAAEPSDHIAVRACIAWGEPYEAAILSKVQRSDRRRGG